MKKIILAVFILVVLLFSGCDEFLGYSDDEYEPEPPDSVVYEITGTAATVDITINNENDGTSQFSDVSLPWSYSFTQSDGFFLYVSSQNQGNSGSVTATIKVNGSVYKTSTSDGAYVIATASGSL